MRRMFTEKQVKEMGTEASLHAIESVESGTIASVVGLDSDGKLVKGELSGGELYSHLITFLDSNNSPVGQATILTNSPTQLDSSALKTLVKERGYHDEVSGTYYSGIEVFLHQYGYLSTDAVSIYTSASLQVVNIGQEFLRIVAKLFRVTTTPNNGTTNVTYSSINDKVTQIM